MSTAIHRVVWPYSQLAPAYDIALGIPNFIGTRTAFEALVKRYGITFRSAADIGCGTGLFACYLSQRWGVPVFGVDRSPEMLAVATRNCRSPNLCFLLQDIRCLRLPCPVNLITANFDTMNHLLTAPELRLAIQRVWQNLTPAGHFIFDLITACQPLGGGRTYLRRFASVTCRVTQQIRWDPRQRILSISVTIRRPGSLVSTLEAHRERAYCPAHVAQWLMDAGFAIRAIHDAVTLRIPTDCPPRIIVVARKRVG
ncbi:MAG: class I SAM-dependent methyltransferase [Deltaproteobacteria bacterium]|nr:class I SAM-dependent methyltransferase [Deltaproteobacteria bacterium]